MSFHVYNFNDVCVTVSCWNSELLPIAAKYPIITGEIGESDGTASFLDTFMTWADSHEVSYLAWTWDTWGCGDVAVLISDYSGTACPGFGAGYQRHLAPLRP
jgi:endoglucanase